MLAGALIAGVVALTHGNPRATASVPASSAGAYTLDWYTIDSGGDRSASGAYALQGTIGQPDAGALAGGRYTLLGGFWGATDIRYTVRVPLARR
jgi:hypothetical protein